MCRYTVALEAEDVASALVRRGIMRKVLKPFKDSIVDGKPPEGSRVVAKALALAAAAGVHVVHVNVNEGGGGDAEAAGGYMSVAAAATGAGAGGSGATNNTTDAAAAGSALCAQLLSQQVPNDLARLPERLTEARWGCTS